MMLSEYYYSLGITAEELDTLQEAFQLYDTNKNGSISTEQFHHIISSLGIVTESKQIDKIVKAADINHDGQIDFNEFVLTMFRYLPHEPQQTVTPVTHCYSNNHVFNDKDAATDEEIMACFQFFDKDHDGRISQKELEDVMVRFNTRLSPKEIKDMMSIADINRDGFIDFDEFKKLLPSL